MKQPRALRDDIGAFSLFGREQCITNLAKGSTNDRRDKLSFKLTFMMTKSQLPPTNVQSYTARHASCLRSGPIKNCLGIFCNPCTITYLYSVHHIAHRSRDCMPATYNDIEREKRTVLYVFGLISHCGSKHPELLGRARILFVDRSLNCLVGEFEPLSAGVSPRSD